MDPVLFLVNLLFKSHADFEDALKREADAWRTVQTYIDKTIQLEAKIRQWENWFTETETELFHAWDLIERLEDQLQKPHANDR